MQRTSSVMSPNIDLVSTVAQSTQELCDVLVEEGEARFVGSVYRARACDAGEQVVSHHTGRFQIAADPRTNGLVLEIQPFDRTTEWRGVQLHGVLGPHYDGRTERVYFRDGADAVYLQVHDMRTEREPKTIPLGGPLF